MNRTIRITAAERSARCAARCAAFALVAWSAGCCATPPLASDHFDLRAPEVAVRGFVHASKYDDSDYAAGCARTDDLGALDEWSAIARDASFESAREVDWIPVEDAGGPPGDRGLVLAPSGDRWIAFSVVATRYLFDELLNQWRPIRPAERAIFDAASPRDAEVDWRIVNVDVIDRRGDAIFRDPEADSAGDAAGESRP